MGVTELVNYVVFDNPVSKKVISCIPGLTKGQVVPQVTVITEKTPIWKLAQEAGPFVRIAGVMGASAVALGAYGAHKSYPKDRADELRAIFEAGNRFHFFHSLALLAVPLTRCPKVSGSLILTGTVLFCGPCYFHAITGENKFGKLAPIGGTMLIIAWLSMVM